MRALTYHGANSVKVDTVPDPVIEQADDIILRVTATAICGSDLHLYRGKIPKVEHGDIFGHEFMGVVEETGSAVTAVAKGDRVVILFVIACGSCFFCNLDQFAACETTNTGRGAILNKSRFHQGRRCSASAICMAASRAARLNMCECPRPTSVRSRCQAHWLTRRFCSSPIFFPPPGRLYSTPGLARARRLPFTALARSA